MSSLKRLYFLAALLVFVCGLLVVVGIFGPGFYRLLLSAKSAGYQVQVSPPPATNGPNLPYPPGPTGAASATSRGDPSGHIVFTCQIYRDQGSEQICMVGPDGSDYHRLTLEDGIRHFYPSLSPDGGSVLYSQYREDNVYELYEFNIGSGRSQRLTDRLGVLTAPEVSPDGRLVAFMRSPANSEVHEIWVMDRNGAKPHRLFAGSGWDPTWSPDGTQVLFASDMGGMVQLYRVGLDGVDPQRVSDLPAIRGRSDWSSSGLITTYSGEAWKREVYVMDEDGSNVRQVTPSGGNSQGPSFSPDGEWIAFTAYFDKPNDIHGCEIYIIRTDGTDLRRLTANDYCDYQPRWGL